MSRARVKEVKVAKKALQDVEKAKESASKLVKQAIEDMSTEGEDDRDTAGQRKFLAEKEKDVGNTAFSGGKFDEAIEHFTCVLKLGGPNCVYYTNRAACYLRMS